MMIKAENEPSSDGDKSSLLEVTTRAEIWPIDIRRARGHYEQVWMWGPI